MAHQMPLLTRNAVDVSGLDSVLEVRQQLHGRGGGLAAATVIRDRLHARLKGSVLDVVAELDAARQERDEQLERVVRGRQLPASRAD